jgi:hypothetical protein
MRDGSLATEELPKPLSHGIFHSMIMGLTSTEVDIVTFYHSTVAIESPAHSRHERLDP